MKITINSASILFLSIIWLNQVQSASMDYRYKRGPPRPPRPPPMPQYIKKWEQVRPTRNANRPRPIPMEQLAGVPIFMPPPAPVGPPIAQTPAPIRNYWKTTKIPFQGVPEKPYQIIPEKPFKNIPEKPYQVMLERPFQIIPQRPYQIVPEKSYQVIPQNPFQVIPEKPFHSSPPINRIHEYDYQIQTNNIATHSFPIKQVDEKGPIHTIPAPNLSLADRPIVVEEVYTETRTKPQHAYAPVQQTSVKSHQYQVTEPNEVYIKNTQKAFKDNQVPYRSESYSNGPTQNYEQPQRQQINKFPNSELSGSLPNQLGDSQISQKELFQLINSQLQHEQQQQQHHQRQPLYDNYEIPPLPQALVQPQFPQQEISFSDYQAMLAQAQMLQSDTPYLNQMQQMAATHNSKTNNQPHQYQSFAYERRAQNNFPSDDQQSTFIATNYNLKAEAPNDAPQDPNVSASNSPYVQEIYDLEESEASNNNVEQKPQLETDQENIASAFYTTLPNQQAAETLASLQAAGKINSNLKQLNGEQPKTVKSSHRTPLEIYVPDSQQLKNYEARSSPKSEEKDATQEGVETKDTPEIEQQEYEETSFQDELKDEQDYSSNQENHSFFGSKIKPKQSNQ